MSQARKSRESTKASSPFKRFKELFLKPSASPRLHAQDTSGKLKKVHGRATKSGRNLRKKRSKSAWHQEFYKDAPKSRFKRFVWILHPKRQFQFWFSKHGLFFGLKLALAGFAFLFLTGLGLYAYYSRGLPEPEEISRRLVSQTTKFYDRTGKVLLYEVYGDEDRTLVKFDDISEFAKQATVAVEDKDFYGHNGISVSGIARAARENFLGSDSGNTQGGSTITQQFVKNSLLTNEKTYERKIKEAILALELERIYTKEEILGFYLNEVPYGGTAYGIESAANDYFAKSAKKLTLDEAATLAAMIQRPTYFSPYGEHTDELLARRDFVLGLMVEQGFITQEETDAAKATDTMAKVGRRGRKIRDIKAPHFVLEIQQQLEDKYQPDTVAKGGLTVITTVDLELQKIAEKAVKDGIAVVDGAGGNNAALVATDPLTGQVLAMVGSRDFEYKGFGAFNAATARRQPGSSFKPYTYAALMKENYGAGSVFYDVPTDFGGGYKPNNFDNGFINNNTMRNHLGKSRNIPAVKSLYIAGLENVMKQADTQGVTLAGKASDYGLSLTLGAGEVKLAEHVNGFTAFANGGKNYGEEAEYDNDKDRKYLRSVYVLKITNGAGEVLKEWKPSEGKQVVDPQIAYILTDILSDEVARQGTFGASLQYFRVPNKQIAIKTGTTNDERDGWLMGYSSRLTAGVWVGHTQNKPMRRSSSQLTGPIWHDFMVAAHERDHYKDAPKFDKPAGIQTLKIDRITGRRPIEGSKNTVSDLFPSWYKLSIGKSSDPFEIDTVSGKLATRCTPPTAKKTVQVGGVTAEIPASDPAYFRWNPPVQAWARRIKISGGGVAAKPTAEDDVHSCDDAKPDITDVSVTESDTSFIISATVQEGTFDLDKIEFKVDGKTVSGGSKGISSSGTYTKTVTVSSGSHKAQVVVTDKGLYTDDATSSSFTANGGDGDDNEDDEEINLQVQHLGGNRYIFTWNSISDGSPYELCIDTNSSDNCYNNVSSPYTRTVNGSGKKAYIEADNEVRSDTESFD